jgi:hypothetical protein
MENTTDWKRAYVLAAVKSNLIEAEFSDYTVEATR